MFFEGVLDGCIAVKVGFMVHRVPSLRSGGQKLGGGLLDGACGGY